MKFQPLPFAGAPEPGTVSHEDVRDAGEALLRAQCWAAQFTCHDGACSFRRLVRKLRSTSYKHSADVSSARQVSARSFATCLRHRSSRTAASSCGWLSQPTSAPTRARPCCAARCATLARERRFGAVPRWPRRRSRSSSLPQIHGQRVCAWLAVARHHDSRPAPLNHLTVPPAPSRSTAPFEQLFASPHGAITTSSTDTFMGQADILLQGELIAKLSAGETVAVPVNLGSVNQSQPDEALLNVQLMLLHVAGDSGRGGDGPSSAMCKVLAFISHAEALPDESSFDSLNSNRSMTERAGDQGKSFFVACKTAREAAARMPSKAATRAVAGLSPCWEEARCRSRCCYCCRHRHRCRAAAACLSLRYINPLSPSHDLASLLSLGAGGVRGHPRDGPGRRTPPSGRR